MHNLFLQEHLLLINHFGWQRSKLFLLSSKITVVIKDSKFKTFSDTINSSEITICCIFRLCNARVVNILPLSYNNLTIKNLATLLDAANADTNSTAMLTMLYGTLHNYILGAPPLGLVQVWKIISPHQIIVQTWKFLCMTWTLERINRNFFKFF